jgi:anti-sigma factor RsiW
MCDYSRKLIAWIDRELPESEAAELERHVAVCAECREQLASFEWASRAFNAYCEATFAAATRRKLPRWLPAAGVAAGIAAAATIAAVLMLPRQHVALVPPGVPPAAEAPHTPINQSQRQYASVRPTRSHNHQRASATEASARASHVRNISSFPAELPIQIAIPADAMFPPGAVPPGMSFTAELTISADGSAERLGLRPRLAGFERRANQP